MSLDRLKQDLKRLQELFPTTDERFRVVRTSPADVECVFIDEKGEKITITGSIMDETRSAVWCTESADEKITSVLNELNETGGCKNQILLQVRKLVSSLCSIKKVSPPKELSNLVPNEGQGASSASDSTSTGSQKSDIETGNESEEDKEVKKAKKALIKSSAVGGSTSVMAARRLMKELKEIRKGKAHESGDISVELADENLFEWNVKIRSFDKDSQVAKDLKVLKEKHDQDFVLLSIRFKEDYPFSFPIVSVVTPRMTDGHIFEGGAICLELLTTEKWSSAYTPEMVIVQVASLLSHGKARIYFDDSQVMVPYERIDLEGAYARLAAFHKQHGWYTPPNEKG